MRSLGFRVSGLLGTIKAYSGPRWKVSGLLGTIRLIKAHCGGFRDYWEFLGPMMPLTSWATSLGRGTPLMRFSGVEGSYRGLNTGLIRV